MSEYRMKSHSTFANKTSEAILKNTDVETLIGIDRYQHVGNYRDGMNFPQEKYDRLYLQVVERLAPFGKRFQLLRMSTSEAADVVQNDLDFIYIDADHSFSGVWQDLMSWYPKVRALGIVSGHDYTSKAHTGVRKAVDLFFQTLNLQVNLCRDGVWWVEKQTCKVPFNRKIFLILSFVKHVIGEGLSTILGYVSIR